MISRAYLVGPVAESAQTHIAGLPALLRALLVLQDAGVRELVLVNFPREHVPMDARLTLDILEEVAHDAETAFVFTCDWLWSSSLSKRLAQESFFAETLLSFGEGAFWVLGSEKLGTFLTALQQQKHHEILAEQRTLAEGEFLLSVSRDKTEIERRLLASLEKPTDGMVARLLNRKISLAITARLLNTSVTPNQMTIFAALFGVLGVYCALQATYWAVLIAALLFQIQSILDGCDGEIARLTFQRSRFGEWLDQSTDYALNLSFFVAIGLVLVQRQSFAAQPIIWSVVVAHVLYQVALYAALVRRADGSGNVTTLQWWAQGVPKNAVNTDTLFYKVKKFVEEAGKRDFFVFAYLPCALVDCLEPAFWWYATIILVSSFVTCSHWLFLGGPRLER
jgi:phosphatidylglycerophosphate synthase